MTDRTVPGTPAWLRARNDRAALQLLLDHGALTRNRLGELTGLSKPTASQMVQRLESVELIRAVGEVSGGRGPNAATYAVRTDQALGVAIDIDSQTMRSTVVDVTGSPQPVAEVTLTGSDRTPAGDVRRGIQEACAAADVDESRIDAVCIGVQGAVDPRTDELRFADTLAGWPLTSVRAHVEDDLGVTVTIENDVNLAAIAERSAGAGQGLGGFALLWLGEGLGLATDLGGAVHRGISGGAGEIGYLPVPRTAVDLDPDAVELQDLIGGLPVAALTQAAGGDGSSYRAAIATLETDAAVRARVVAALAPRVALGIVPVLALLDPERVVIGGPTGAACGDALATAVAAEIRRDGQWNPDIAATGVPRHPVLEGSREHLLTSLRTSLFDRLDRIAI
ncbi:ROK family transcriptional regulator [Microbacterium sp.]|uniref:ROK family transcriptional regulator n=1 Tax=Microbacterium sp. TaxID=51671 RepID=UPI001AD4EC02|nr:ROK family transcriptional regulator [Microbacterium sp.]MBN9184424.1 ROK family transcriptional regulator [Microbacterium sp.]MBN9193684.1 ROK family transcriptional regulator [Microbacterium sp.]